MPTTRVLALLLAVSSAGAASAQIPDKFTNLQVLPKDISKAELVMTMRNLAGDLGFRCHNCHVGPDDLTGMDFATDEKPTKKVAREMLKIVQSVNATLQALPPRDEPRGSVTCYTCHRSAQRPPERTDVLLARLAQQKGASAAVARYQELKKEHANDGQYDYTPRALGTAAGRLLEAGRTDDALVLATLNAELYPDVSPVLSQVGQILMRKGDKSGAAEQFRKALKLDPKNQAAQRGLKAAEEPAKQ
jgi:Flp pilus assembly protein TadD